MRYIIGCIGIIIMSALGTGCMVRSVDMNLAFERVCYGDGICHVIDLETGKEYFPPHHYQCKTRYLGSQ